MVIKVLATKWPFLTLATPLFSLFSTAVPWSFTKTVSLKKSCTSLNLKHQKYRFIASSLQFKGAKAQGLEYLLLLVPAGVLLEEAQLWVIERFQQVTIWSQCVQATFTLTHIESLAATKYP